MLITPKQFVYLLKNSSLSPIEQQAVLDFLSTLSSEQIQTLAQILKRDVESQERLMADIEGKRDALLLQFNLEAKKMDMMEQEKQKYLAAVGLMGKSSEKLSPNPFIHEEAKEALEKKEKRDSFVPPSALPPVA